MVTHSTLNKGGRLGNQMFQYASLVGIKYKTNLNTVLGIQQMKDSFINKCFNLSDIELVEDNTIVTTTTFREKFHKFDSTVFDIFDETDFFGYFQNEKYFEHCKDTIKKEFTFKDTTLREVQEFIQPYKNSTLVSVHIRRTDYTILSKIHPVCSFEYYEKAIQHLDKSDTMFIVTSDDIPWCKDVFQNRNNFIFSTNPANDFDMCLISNCDHNIIANSTYSWWGAWLGENLNKKIIAPKQWFGDCEHTRRWQLTPTDIIPERWMTFKL